MVFVALLFGQRAALPAEADPPAADDARRQLQGRAQDADAALATLATRLSTALEAGRRGAGRTVSGSTLPADELEAAAEGVESAGSSARAAVDAVVAVRAAAEVAGDVLVIDEPVTDDDLRAIAAQLRATAAPADEFATHRMEAADVVLALEDALAALEADDPSAAAAAVERGEHAHAALAEWETDLVTLPLWLETSAVLLDALGDLAAARLAGDADAEAEAAERYAAASVEGRRADQALGIAIAEGGAAITDAPLLRLGAVLERVEAARATLSGVLP